MASEAQIVELFGNPKGEGIWFTVAANTGISKGTLLKLADPRTASASTGRDVFAGVAAADKDATDEATRITAYTKGVFDIYVGAVATTLGSQVVLSGSNLVADVGTLPTASHGTIVGKALETGSISERIQVLIGGY